MSDFDLRTILREPHDEDRAQKNWERIDHARRTRTSSANAPLKLWALGVAAALVALGSFAWSSLGRNGEPVALRSLDGQPLEQRITGNVEFADGSRLWLRAVDGRSPLLELLENADGQIRFWLRAGQAHFEVVPNGPRRWIIETGPATIEVLGTGFDVLRTQVSISVRVTHGSVLVRGPGVEGGMRRLHLGERIVVPLQSVLPPSQEVSPRTSDGARASEKRENLARDGQRSSRSAATSRATPSRRGPADPATYRQEPEAEETSAAETRPAAQQQQDVGTTPSFDDRMREADALRQMGDASRAVAILRELATDSSPGAHREIAAYTLARLYLERLDRPADAAEQFRVAIDAGLRGSLLEVAWARRVEALSKVDREAARDARREYEERFPEGAWRTRVRAWAR